MNASLRTSFSEERWNESGDEVDGEEAHRILRLLLLDLVVALIDALVARGSVGESASSSMISVFHKNTEARYRACMFC